MTLGFGHTELEIMFFGQTLCPARKMKTFLLGLIGGMSFGLVTVCLVALDDTTLNVPPEYDVPGIGHKDSAIGRRPAYVVSRDNFSKSRDTAARDPAKNIRVLCWLYFRASDIFELKVNASWNTWGRKCNKFLIFLDKHNESLQAIGLDKVAETIQLSDSIIVSVYRYIYKHYFDEADWFFSAETIPFVIMENLRHFLSDKDPDVPIYYGHKMKMTKHVPGFLYADRCAGIVLSRAGLKTLGTRGFSVPECDKYKFQLGIQFAQCMFQLGVQFGDTRDTEGKSTFLLFTVGHTIAAPGNFTFDYRSDDEIQGRKGTDRISKSLISIGRSGPYGSPGYNFFIFDLIQVGS